MKRSTAVIRQYLDHEPWCAQCREQGGGCIDGESARCCDEGKRMKASIKEHWDAEGAEIAAIGQPRPTEARVKDVGGHDASLEKLGERSE